MISSSICTALSSAATHLQSATKIMEETAIWTILCFYPVPPLNNVEKQWSKVASGYVMGSQHWKGKRGNFKHTFRNFHYIFTLIVWNLQKEKKNEVLCMLFQKPQMCFNELDYVTVHFVMNIMTSNSVKNGIKTTTIMFSSYYYLALVEKGLLQAHSGKCCSLDRLWCICFCCFILPNHG